MHDLALRAVGLALFVGILAAGVYAAEESFGGAPREAAVQGFRLEAVGGPRTAAPGTEVTFPLVLRNGGEAPAHVRLAGPEGGAPSVRFTPEELTVPAHGAAGAFATVDLRGAGAMAGRVGVRALEDGHLVASLALPLSVREAPGAKEGDAVEVDYVGRFANGTVFDTSVEAVAAGPFGLEDQPGREYDPLRVVLGPGSGLIQGFWRSLEGMAEGQSRTFVLPPGEAYGNATRTERVPRDLELPRDSEPLDRVQRVPRAVLAQYANGTLAAGQLLPLPDPSGNARTYLVRDLDAANATIVWQVKVGDPFTVYPAWPNLSRAHEVTDAQVVFRTTPPDAHAFTWYEFWPDATRVRSVDGDRIVLEHNPPEGLAFDLPRRGEALRARVLEVTEDAIVVEAPNEHPLAGQALTFDVTVRSLRRAGP